MCPIRLEINDFPISLKRLSSHNHLKIYHFDKKKNQKSQILTNSYLFLIIQSNKIVVTNVVNHI